MGSTGQVVGTAQYKDTMYRMSYTAPSSGYYYIKMRKLNFLNELDECTLGCYLSAPAAR
jgi:hypothetical protein